MNDHIVIRGARLHNLNNINLDIPKNQLVVLTGVSGSGKSTLGFDILLKESQRQYMEALGILSFGLSKPPVDLLQGLSPAVSIDQNLTNNSPRSTVGTVTDTYTYLRVLYAKLGHRPCPQCGHDIPPLSEPGELTWDGEIGNEQDNPQQYFPCPHCGKAIPELDMAHFSFNKPEGACPTCTGLGKIHHANLQILVDEKKSLAGGAVQGWETQFIQYNIQVLQATADYYGYHFDPTLPIEKYTPQQQDLLYYGVESPQFQRHFPGVTPPATVNRGRFEGVATSFLRRYAERVQDAEYRAKMDEYLVTQVCPDCGGTRLKPESRLVTIHGKSIVDVSQLPLTGLIDWLSQMFDAFTPLEKEIASSIFADLSDRIARLIEVGAGYLTLERDSPSLSAGEAQRLRLAALLGSSLSGMLYVLDEPTIGLHQRDTHNLIRFLRRIRDLGNSVLVIEHDLDMIKAADTVIDFGPGAGKHGGQIVAVGSLAELKKNPFSITGRYLNGDISIPVPTHRRPFNSKAIIIRGARHHNLKNITATIPLGGLVAVTGVSGSGKTSLIFDILDRVLRHKIYGAGNEEAGEHDEINGIEQVTKVITIDQKHVTRMPRSNTATYTDVFSSIREVFAATPEARQRGFRAGHFSFNKPGGRCERCEGSGLLSVKMHFLPDVEVRCPACHGKRFSSDTLSVNYNGFDISQVLNMTVEEALDVFREVPAARSRLQVLVDVGLGYLQLGQPSTTLSGGEAQRIKLAKELGRQGNGHTLYLLDEPTTGLHLADTARLLNVLNQLVDHGNSVIVVEHNLELVKTADWVIDMGPEGGASGGQIIAAGTPEQVSQVPESFTGQYLKKLLRE